MIKLAHSPSAGLRRFDEETARVDELAATFQGLPDELTPTHVVSAFKRAAPYVGVRRGVLALVDTLFAWTKPADWRAGSVPIVWPSNETLARKLQVGVRQLQNLLARARALGLISHRESANGNRVGRRRADDTIEYAYGINLAVLAVRLDEFRVAAVQGEALDARLKALRRRLAAALRAIRTVAQAVDGHSNLPLVDQALQVAELAVRQLRGSRDEAVLRAAVDRLEAQSAECTKAIAELNGNDRSEHPARVLNQNAPSGVASSTHTTTSEPIIAKATVNGSGLAKWCSETRSDSTRDAKHRTAVETDLSDHAVGPEQIADVASIVFPKLSFGVPTWRDVVAAAEGIVAGGSIREHVWRSACRIMGARGAAAAVIAVERKRLAGEVRKASPYLNEMVRRATVGELHLGRTYHGLKDATRSTRMGEMRDGVDPRSIGAIISRASRSPTLSRA